QRKRESAPGTADARKPGDIAKPPPPKQARPGPPAVVHDAVGARVAIVPDSPSPPGAGARSLADGLLAEGDEATSKGWVGWEPSAGPVQVTLDLNKPTKVTKLGAHFLRATSVTLPVQVEFFVSDDGKTFERVATLAEADGVPQRGWFTAAV